MKKQFSVILGILFLVFGLFSCTNEEDSLQVPADLQVQDFIWKGLNLYYLWQEDVTDLSDRRFADQQQLNLFLKSKSTPEQLFQDLLNKPISKFQQSEAIDRFSIMVNDYTYLENLFQGVTLNNGIKFGLKYKNGSSTEVFGWVKYIMSNSDAATKNISRGEIFYAVNGVSLNADNYQSLLNNTNYTLNFADFDNGNITPNGKSISLSKTQVTENPIYLNKIFEVDNKKIAYLVYNGFTANYNEQLNNAFAELKSSGATHLILDLRYNQGGSIDTATYLASMITGQFDGQLFAKQQWNPKIQSHFESLNPAYLVNNFTNVLSNGIGINSLNLSKVIILTSKSTASASELVINGLKPYIDVIQIGDITTGKNVGSVTLYDSPTFTKKDANKSHRYAMQPLVLKLVNNAGFGDYINGLEPNILMVEDMANLGQLGDTSEPLLAEALDYISKNGRVKLNFKKNNSQQEKDLIYMQKFENEMYIKQLPFN